MFIGNSKWLGKNETSPVFIDSQRDGSSLSNCRGCNGATTALSGRSDGLLSPSRRRWIDPLSSCRKAEQRHRGSCRTSVVVACGRPIHAARHCGNRCFRAESGSHARCTSGCCSLVGRIHMVFDLSSEWTVAKRIWKLNCGSDANRGCLSIYRITESTSQMRRAGKCTAMAHHERGFRHRRPGAEL